MAVSAYSWALYTLTERCGMSVLDAKRKLDLADESRTSYERLVELEIVRCGRLAGLPAGA